MTSHVYGDDLSADQRAPHVPAKRRVAGIDAVTEEEKAMANGTGAVVCDITMSADGYTAGPNQTGHRVNR